MSSRTIMIGLDWGTTSLRAYRIGLGGAVVEQRAADAGILKVADGGFADAMMTAVGDWLAAAPGLPVVAAGMIGSRQGWREIAYVPCPAGLAELAAGLGQVTAPDGRSIRLVPGLVSGEDAGSFPDVMRGEETQILGALARGGPQGRRCFILPGTHSKWAWSEDGRITRFATYMTGEVYDVLTRHSILGRLMTDDRADPAAFAGGLDRARACADAPPGHLLHELFGARTLGLFARIPPGGLASYLSGLLIGAEIGAALKETGPVEVTILGSSTLGPLYAEALAAAGAAAVVGDIHAAARGLYAIARQAGLIEGASHG